MNLAGLDLQAVIWCVLALLLAGNAMFWARRRAAETNARGPGVLLSIAIWIGIFAIVLVAAQAAEFWARLGSLFR